MVIHGMLAFLDSFLLYWLFSLVKPFISLFSFPQSLHFSEELIAFEAVSISVFIDLLHTPLFYLIPMDVQLISGVLKLMAGENF